MGEVDKTFPKEDLVNDNLAGMLIGLIVMGVGLLGMIIVIIRLLKKVKKEIRGVKNDQDLTCPNLPR